MPVFDFSAAPADENKTKSQCTYTTYRSNETTATPEKPVLILDNSKREWKNENFRGNLTRVDNGRQNRAVIPGRSGEN